MWAAIGDLVDKVKQRHPAKLGRDWFAYLDISSVDRESKRIIAAQRIPAHSAPSRARQVVCAYDILVSTVRPNLNAVASVPGYLDGEIASTGFCVLRPNPTRVCPRYLFYYSQTKTFVSHLSRVATGASYPAVTDSDVLEMPIPLPPLSEQKRIAGLLEKADQLRRSRRCALELSDTFLPAAFLELFGDPIKNSAGFRTEQLEDLIDPDRPISYGILMPGPDIPGGVPYVRVTDIQNGKIISASIRRTTAATDQAYKRSKLKGGDLLMTIRGHVGRMAIVPPNLEGANITQDTARLAPRNDINAHYLMGCLSADGMQRWMADLTRGAAVQGINLGDVKKLPIPVPPISLQKKWVSLVSYASHLRSTEREALRQADHLFQSLLDSAFR